MSSLAGANRASYNRINPNMSVGRKPTRAEVPFIGVFHALSGRPMLTLPFKANNVRFIASLNADMNALDVACRIASGQTVTGFYSDSNNNIPLQRVVFRGIK